MSNYEGMLKAISTFMLVIAIISIIGGLALAGIGGVTCLTFKNADNGASITFDKGGKDISLEQLSEELGVNVSSEEAVLGIGILFVAFGIIIILSGVWGIIVASFGKKAAKGGSTRGAFVVGIIGVVCEALVLVGAVIANKNFISALIWTIVYGLYTYAVYKLRTKPVGYSYSSIDQL
jgi:hypothetical protein